MYTTPENGDVFEELNVKHQPRRFVVTGPLDPETDWTSAKIGLKRIKPNGQLSNTTYMRDIHRLAAGEAMRLVERDGKPYTA